MEIFEKINSVTNAIAKLKENGNSIGFVPTMGALHEGHLALIAASKRANNITVCSIFVNPIQFNNTADLLKYPKTLEEDVALLKSAKCDIIFAPSHEEMYPNGNPDLTLDFHYQNSILEGKYRAGHFNGVGLVVSKLFNIIQPNQAYFGQKDFQQCLVVRQIVKELCFPITVHIVKTVRDENGLAMSSRNKRLSPEERQIASIIFKTLQWASGRTGSFSIVELKVKIKLRIVKAGLQIEYIDFIDVESDTLANEIVANRQYALCVAAYLGEVRLIDNVLFNA